MHGCGDRRRRVCPLQPRGSRSDRNIKSHPPGLGGDGETGPKAKGEADGIKITLENLFHPL